MEQGGRQFYEFGRFRLNPTERTLLRDDQIVHLTPKAFDTLLLLVRNSSHLLEKDELVRLIWPDTFVEEGSLANNIFLLRRALGEDPAFIETVPRRGYRFVGSVRVGHLTVSARSDDRSEDAQGQGTDALAPSPPAVRSLSHRRAAPIAVVGLLVSLTAAGWFVASDRRGTDSAVDSVAVLPFLNATADPDMDYLSEGITDSLINHLTQVRGLRVMARSTVFRFKGHDADPQDIGRQLHVRSVLTGRVQRRAGTLVVQTELVDVEKGQQVWGGQYDRTFADVFAMQDSIAREIAQSVRLRFTSDGRPSGPSIHAVTSKAYEPYLKGRYWWNKGTKEGYSKAIDYFSEAIAQDAGYAQAYAGLADCYYSLVDDGLIASREGYLKAKDAALKAVELDETLPDAHTSLALIKSGYDWDWSGAEKEFKRAIELNPASPIAHRFRATALWQVGRLDEAVAETQLSLENDPLSLGANVDLSVEFFLARRYNDAIKQAHKVLELDPENLSAYYFLGVVYSKKSMFKESMASFEKGAVIEPVNELALTGLGYGYAVTGRRAEALKVLGKLSELSKQKYVSPVWMAKIYSGLEMKDEAFAWLEKAYDDRSIVSVAYLKTNPMFDPLRSDQRYKDLLRRTSLVP